MKRRFSTRIITCIATSAVLAVGTLSFTVISAIADEAVSYYGLSADGTVISGTVTDYTKIASTDTAWGTAGKETWYVADGIVNIITTTYDYDNNKNVYNPVEIKGNVNVILKNGAEVSVVNGIAGTDATITFYSESENASGVIGFIGATGDDGGWGTTESGPDEANGKNGEDGKDAVNVLSFTVAGGTVTVIGGDGGKGGGAGYGTNYDTNESYYGVGGDGGNGSVAITDNTKVYLNGGRLNVTAGRGGNPGTNTHVPSEQQDNYNGKPGNNGTSVSGIYAVNGILNVNKLDDSDTGDTSGDFKLLSANGYENAKLDIIGHGTAKVTDGTVIKTYGDISVAGTLSVDNGTILTNGSITKADSAAQITKTNGGIIRRFTPAYGTGYTLDYAGGKCIAETGYKIKLSDGNTLIDIADANTIVSESNRLNIVRIGDGEIIDDSEPCTNVMPYCIKANNTNETTVTDGNVFAVAGDSSRFTFALNDPDEYRFSGVTVTDADGNAVPDDMYTFDSTTGEFIALSVDRNLIVTADASLKDIEISVTDSENNPVSTVDIGTDFDNGNPTKTVSLKVKVTEGGSIAKYRVVKESDLNKASGAITDTSSFTVSYTAGDEWGTADDGSSKIAKGATATFTVKPDSNLVAGTYTEDFIVITDRTAYADASAGTQDKALARFTLTYKVEHESDGKLYYSDLTGHYNLCKNCQAKINKENHTFDIKTVNEDTLALPADCVNPAKYFYSCECGAHTNDTTLVFESGAPSGHKFGEWEESKSANCEEGGKEKHICSVCQFEEERDTAPLGHDWNAEYTTDVNPTCTQPGSKSIHCSRCDATKDVTEIEPLGHDWEDDFTIDVKPTCTQPGSKSIHCSRCDATKDVTEIEPTGHSFGEWTVSKDSTCVAGGQKTRKCEICGYTEYEDTDIDSDAHEWEEDYTIDKEPTCTTEGSKSIHCSRCDATKDSTVIPVTDHTYGEWEVVTPSTCIENGVKKHACIHCGFEQTEIIEPAHEWEDSRTVDIAPSCTEQGEDSVHCRNCDERKDIKEISPKGHDWSEWKTLVEPTITSEGKECRSCSVCGIKEEKALPKLSGKKEWKHDEKKHWHVDDNGNIIDVDDHEFKWVVDKEPTATEPGIGHYECIACAFEKAPEEFGKRNPETGASSLAAWIAVAAVAGGAVPVTYKARKRKNK
jgi:methionine-rich copper-binding protein CopC